MTVITPSGDSVTRGRKTSRPKQGMGFVVDRIKGKWKVLQIDFNVNGLLKPTAVSEHVSEPEAEAAARKLMEQQRRGHEDSLLD
jgi:hypothetical protein